MNYAMPTATRTRSLDTKQRAGAMVAYEAAAIDEMPNETVRRTVYGEKRSPVVLAASVGLHIAVFGALFFTWRGTLPDEPAKRPAMAVELLPLPAAPPVPPEEVAPGVEQTKAEETPKPVVDTRPPLPKPAVVLRPTVAASEETPREPEPEPVRPQQQRVEQTTAPAPAPLPPREAAAAPVLGTPTVSDKVARQTWQGQVMADLERSKRYPAGEKEKDRIRMTITVDRSGRVLDRRIVASGGHARLDAEAMAAVMRASPFPEPPSSLSDRELTFDIFVDFQTGQVRGRRR